MTLPDRGAFRELARRGNLVPLVRRVFSDQLTPVLGYRRLVAADERTAPSFLLESVENGDKQGRYSFIGAQPRVEIIARQHEVTIEDHGTGQVRSERHDDPLDVPRAISARLRPVMHGDLPGAFRGGWVGYAGYDSVRYVEEGKLPFAGVNLHIDRGVIRSPDHARRACVYRCVDNLGDALLRYPAATTPISPASGLSFPSASAKSKTRLRTVSNT